MPATHSDFQRHAEAQVQDCEGLSSEEAARQLRSHGVNTVGDGKALDL